MDKYEVAEYLPTIKLKILDYECGNGEVAYFLAKQHKDWTVIGCDNIENLSKTLEYYSQEYVNELEPSNVCWKTTQEAIKEAFDYVLYPNTQPKINSSHFIKVQR